VLFCDRKHTGLSQPGLTLIRKSAHWLSCNKQQQGHEEMRWDKDTFHAEDCDLSNDPRFTQTDRVFDATFATTDGFIDELRSNGQHASATIDDNGEDKLDPQDSVSGGRIERCTNTLENRCLPILSAPVPNNRSMQRWSHPTTTDHLVTSMGSVISPYFYWA
jgi:hypothetical protein